MMTSLLLTIRSNTKKIAYFHTVSNHAAASLDDVRSGEPGRRPSAPLALADPGRGRGVVAVAAPGGMIEMDHEVAVVRGDGGVERQLAEVAPVPEGAPLESRRAVSLALVGDLDVEGERPAGRRISAVEDLRQDLVPEIQVVAGDPRLVRSDQQAHEGRRPGGLAGGLT